MEVYRFPVLVWRDEAGGFTAALAEAETVAGYGETAKEALSQVREFLSWLYKMEPWRDGPTHVEAKLIETKVKVRPEYLVGHKVYPYDRSLTLRVACVDCDHVSGLRSATLPRLGIQFYYSQGRLKDLVRHYVQKRLAGLPPRQVARYLTPAEMSLEHVTVKTRRDLLDTDSGPDLSTLEVVAEPIGTRVFKARYSAAYGRERQVEELVRRLDSGASVLLVGERGCGKTTVLVEAVRKLERQKAEYKRRYWMSRGARMIAGLPYLGQWEARCEALIEELSNIGGYLCVESLLELVRSGGRTAVDSVGAFLAPYLERGELRLVAEGTPTEVDACRRLLPRLVELMTVLPLPELESPLEVLQEVSASLRQKHKITESSDTVPEVYRLHRRFLPYQSFPGRASLFLRRLFETQEPLDREVVLERFSKETGLPLHLLEDERPLPPAEVEQFFRHRVVGQEAACGEVTRLVTTFKAGLNDPGRPLGVLLFSGPTGVGKTQMAKSLADYFFGAGEDQERLVRLDMSEYGGPWATQRLLGNEQRPGELVRRVRRQPFSVVLLDEIEKAHPLVFDLLLGVFDEGRLTDPWGRTTTFRSAVVVMTSNLGADALRPVGLSQRNTVSYEAEAMSFFRPEFYNRIDSVVKFEPLTPRAIVEIARLEIAAVSRREGLLERGIELKLNEPVIEHLAELGYDARYGARPLKRTIEEKLVVPLSRYLVEKGELRHTQVVAELIDGEIALL